MQQEQQQIKPLLHKGIKLSSQFTYRAFSKRGYRVIPKLVIGFDERGPFSKEEKMMKVLGVSKKVKMIKKLDLAKLVIPDSKAIFLAKKMISVSELRLDDNNLVWSWSKYMKSLKSLSFSESLSRVGQRIYYEYGRSSQQQNRKFEEKTARLSIEYYKYLTRLEMKTIKVNFSYEFWRGGIMDYMWRFDLYPESIRRIWFNGPKFSKTPLNISMAHLKNLKELRFEKFEFAHSRYNSIETVQLVVNLLPQVTQIEALHMDFVENFVIDDSICAALKSLTKLKKARFSISWEDKNQNFKILESLEDCPLEDLDLRIFIRRNESIISLISDFLPNKKNLKALKLRITNKSAFDDLKPIEDLLKVVDGLPELSSFSIITKVTPRGLKEDDDEKSLSEINLSFDKLLSRSIPLKKFKISLHQHIFSQKSFMKLLASLKKFSTTLEKLRIDVGYIRPKSSRTQKDILDFIKSLHNIRSLRLYSLDISQKIFFLGLSEAIQRLKFLRVFCLGETSDQITKPDGLKRILVKPGLEMLDCGASKDFENILRDGSGQALDLAEIQQKNPEMKSWPNYPRYLNYRR